MFDNEKRMKIDLDRLVKENDIMQKDLSDEIKITEKLRRDMAYHIKNHEEEVQLRLQFESKLNSLHALHRDVKAKYERAIDDIHNNEESIKEKNKLIEAQKLELIELRTLRIEHESKIAL